LQITICSIYNTGTTTVKMSTFLETFRRLETFLNTAPDTMNTTASKTTIATENNHATLFNPNVIKRIMNDVQFTWRSLYTIHVAHYIQKGNYDLDQTTATRINQIMALHETLASVNHNLIDGLTHQVELENMTFMTYNDSIRESVFQSPDRILEIQPHNDAYFMYPITAAAPHKGPPISGEAKTQAIIQEAVNGLVDQVQLEHEYSKSRNISDVKDDYKKAMKYFFTLCGEFKVRVHNNRPRIEFRPDSVRDAKRSIGFILDTTRPVATAINDIIATKNSR
jgi:hypothetical protein